MEPEDDNGEPFTGSETVVLISAALLAVLMLGILLLGAFLGALCGC